MHVADELAEQDQLRNTMRQQMHDYARMRQLMQQLRSQTRQQRSTQRLTAMLHIDANDNRQVEFPGVDKPYTQNGTPVAATARVRV